MQRSSAWPFRSSTVLRLSNGRSLDARREALDHRVHGEQEVREEEQIFGARVRGNPHMSVLLTRIEQFDGVAILATNLESALDEALMRRCLAVFRFQAPSPASRAEIWRKHLPALSSRSRIAPS